MSIQDVNIVEGLGGVVEVISTVTINAAETIASGSVSTRNYKTAVVYFDITAFVMAASEELDIYVQVSYDGVDWADVANLHYDDGEEADPTRATVSVGASYGDDGIKSSKLFTDGALADDTVVDLPLGAFLRFKAVGTNTPDAVIDATVVLR